ncbi:hypothetical protein HK098_007127, partial [Nowakowskiella sp. JEL0407]
METLSERVKGIPKMLLQNLIRTNDSQTSPFSSAFMETINIACQPGGSIHSLVACTIEIAELRSHARQQNEANQDVDS